MNDRICIPNVFTVRHFKKCGRLVSVEEVHNVVVNELMNHLLNVGFNDAAKNSLWYTGIFKGVYSPTVNDAAATFAVAANEATEYESATRPRWQCASSTAQVVTNSANTANFIAQLTPPATVDIQGAFVISNNVKAGATGVLMAAARFTTKKTMEDGDLLAVSYSLGLANPA